ncbi:hypothetical protein ACJX0J_006407, partial [Zea mays]
MYIMCWDECLAPVFIIDLVSLLHTWHDRSAFLDRMRLAILPDCQCSREGFMTPDKRVAVSKFAGFFLLTLQYKAYLSAFHFRLLLEHEYSMEYLRIPLFEHSTISQQTFSELPSFHFIPLLEDNSLEGEGPLKIAMSDFLQEPVFQRTIYRDVEFFVFSVQKSKVDRKPCGLGFGQE